MIYEIFSNFTVRYEIIIAEFSLLTTVILLSHRTNSAAVFHSVSNCSYSTNSTARESVI